jgi:hypothetical protein
MVVVVAVVISLSTQSENLQIYPGIGPKISYPEELPPSPVPKGKCLKIGLGRFYILLNS